MLDRLFDSLSNETYKDFSVLVGDQSEEGVLDSLFMSYEGKFAMQRVRIAPCSLSEARNFLLPLADGDVISFADDDCYFAKDAFRFLVEYAQKYPNAGCLVGEGFSSPVPGDGFLAPAKRLTRYSVFSKCPSWCIFIRTDVCRYVGDFDVSLGVGAPSPWQSGDETDYLLRVLSAGQKILRCPSIHVFHDAESTLSPDIDKIFNYGVGRMYLIHKHTMPFWFALVNLLYPLVWFVYECLFLGVGAARKRKAMFLGRWDGFRRILMGKLG